MFARHKGEYTVTTDQIRYFLALAQRLNFRAVAEQFFIAQPTLSRQIANLEAEVRAPLFIRDSSKVELTPAGQAMYESMNEVYQKLDSTLRRVREVDAAGNGKLVLALEEDQTLPPSVLEAVRRFSARYPSIHLSMLRTPLRDLRDGLLNQSLDVCVSLFLDGSYLRNLEYVTLSEDPACLALSRGLAASLPPKVTPAELEQVVSQTPLHLIEDDFFLISYKPTAQLRENMHITTRDEDICFDGDPLSILLMVAAGLCSSILNSTHMASIDPNISLLEIEGASTYKKILVSLPNSPNPAVSQFLEILRELLPPGA